MLFSQPAALVETPGDPDRPPEVPPPLSPATSTLISLAATGALKDGTTDTVRDMLGSDPAIVEAYNLALLVQQARGDAPEQETARRLSLRTQDEVEKRRAALKAAELIADEERAALYAAADSDAEKFTGVLSAADLEGIPDPEPLIEDFLAKQTVVRLYGAPKSYKSFIMLDMAGCVGAGITWQGKKTIKSDVLYVVAEGVRGIKRRVRAWEAHNKRPMTGVHFYPRAVQIARREEMKPLVAYAKRGGYKFIIFDTQARCTVGIEENSPTGMGVVIAALDTLKEVTGACVALVHHSGVNSTRARGTTAVLGAVDGEFRVEAKKDSYTVTLETTDQKDMAEHQDIKMDLYTPGPGMSLAVKSRADWYRPTIEDLPPLSGGETRALRAVAGFYSGAPLTMLAADLDMNKGTLYRTLDGLLRKGCITKQGATYKIDGQGRKHLEAGDTE